MGCTNSRETHIPVYWKIQTVDGDNPVTHYIVPTQSDVDMVERIIRTYRPPFAGTNQITIERARDDSYHLSFSCTQDSFSCTQDDASDVKHVYYTAEEDMHAFYHDTIFDPDNNLVVPDDRYVCAMTIRRGVAPVYWKIEAYVGAAKEVYYINPTQADIDQATTFIQTHSTLDGCVNRITVTESKPSEFVLEFEDDKSGTCAVSHVYPGHMQLFYCSLLFYAQRAIPDGNYPVCMTMVSRSGNNVSAP